MRKLLKNLGVSLISVAITLVVAEFAFRWILFSDGKFLAHLKQPGLYARNYADVTGPIFSEEHWKLYTLLGGVDRPPAKPHPLLGWIGGFDRDTYAHFGEAQLGRRRPVLLFGDSFAQCVESTCFEEILNGDSAFAREHMMLNYGVGGYGLDQIGLLAEKVVPRFKKPFVVLSMMTRDMERAMFPARVGQKPFYTLEKGALTLHNTPIDSVPERWFASHKPEIGSYLLRLFQHRVLGDTLYSEQENWRFKDGMKNLNEALLRKTVGQLQASGTDFIVLIFEPIYGGESDWRTPFLRALLERMHVPYLFTGDLVHKDGYRGGAYAKYEQYNNGHPTTYQNELVAREIKAMALDSNYTRTLLERSHREWAHKQRATDKGSVDDYVERISGDSTWYSQVEAKAKQRGIPADSMLWLDAAYMVKDDSLKRANAKP